MGRVVCHTWCHIACRFGGCTILRLTRQWTPYRTRLSPSLYSLPTLASLTVVKGRLWRAPEAMRCEQGVFFAIFHFCMCPLGRHRARPSKAPQVEHICGIEGHWCQVIVFRRIGRLLNPSRRYYNIFVRLSRHFWVFFRQYCFFLPVMMSSGDPTSQRCAQLTS